MTPSRLRAVAGLLLAGGLLLSASAAMAQPPAAADPNAEFVRTAVAGATLDAPAATLVFQNRPIAELRATVMSRTPAMRAAAAQRFLNDLVSQPRSEPVTARPLGGGMMISVGALDVFGLVPADVDPLGAGTVEDTAQRAVGSLRLALDEAIELHTPWRMAGGAAAALLATIALVFLLRLLMRAHRWALTRTTTVADRQLQRLPGAEAVRASRLTGVVRHLVGTVSGAAGLLLLYGWLTFVLRRFPYTRPWGESLRAFLLERFEQFALSMLGAVPDLFTVLLIVAVTRFAVKVAALLFGAVEDGRAILPGVHPDTAQTTRRLTTGLLWLFALALAFPHLPGSDTDAFKGVSVFVGLMISLGSSGIVNQVMSGLTLTYARALKTGDFVKIGEVEGTVTQLGLLSTKLRTHRREELTMPNAVVMSAVTTNYSRLQREGGVLVPTSLTIGYDAPWRQVHALLLMAAARTAGLRAEPEPAVRQAALRDFYVEYVLLVCLEDPASKGRVLDELHAHIQDAFNEYGVQIMSPNYEADSAEPKIVPRDKWFAAPAVGGESARGL